MRNAEGFSILWWIELVLRAPTEQVEDDTRRAFQYPLVDRVGFEGLHEINESAGQVEFQYPLVDRVGFEG